MNKSPRRPPPAARSEGLVVSVHGAWLRVRDARGQVHRVRARRGIGPVACGDNIDFTAARGGGIIEALRPRVSVLTRPDEAGEPRPVAANLDQVLVVVAPAPPTPPSFLDRYLTNLALQDLPAVIVLNKLDLLTEPAPAEGSVAPPPFLAQRARYQAIGYPVLAVSAKAGTGLEALRASVKDRCSIMVGVSGAGKSSLANQLIPGLEVPVGALSNDQSHGRHTTSTARVLQLPFGGTLIDSPGVRDFATWHIPSVDVVRGFREIAALDGQCQFRDCRHAAEPGCAVKAAVDAGAVTEQRWRAYLDILNESLETERTRYD